MQRLSFSLAVTLAAACVACGDLEPGQSRDDAGDDSELALDIETDSTTDELTVTGPKLTLWIDPTALPQTRNGSTAWVIKGRVSKDLTDVFSFVFDDLFGTATLTSARKFEVVLSDAEIADLLTGTQLFVRLLPKAGDYQTYFVRLRLRAYFTRFTGSSRMYVLKLIKPVIVGDHVTYRGQVSLPSTATDLKVYTTDNSEPNVAKSAPRAWRLDWNGTKLVGAANPPTDPVYMVATYEGGSRTVKYAGIDLTLISVALTTDDPYEIWPAPSCSTAVNTCVKALPAGVQDTEACGEAREVRACCYWNSYGNNSAFVCR